MHGKIEWHVDFDTELQNSMFIMHFRPRESEDEMGERKLTWTFSSKAGAIKLLKDLLEVLHKLS